MATADKYEIIFKRVSKKESVGEVKAVKVGDIVGYICKHGSRMGAVVKVKPRAKEVRTANAVYCGHTLHRGEYVAFDHITEVLRPKEPIKREAAPDEAGDEDIGGASVTPTPPSTDA